MFTILTINPGASSLKIGIFFDSDEKYLCEFERSDDINFCTESISDFLNKHSILKLDAVVGRGGLLKPIKSGTYIVNDLMIKELKEAKRGDHPSNLGGLLAYDIAFKFHAQPFVVDPVSVDEMDDIARISGLNGIERESLSHALNMKAQAKKFAKAEKKKYDELKLIVAHLGSGISISVHSCGRMVDLSNPRDEGPFSVERCGSLPLVPLVSSVIEKKMGFDEFYSMIFRRGGLYSYLGTKSLNEVIERINGGDQFAEKIFDAMIYQIAKEIGAMATALNGQVDAIIITGGMAKCDELVNRLKKRISFISRLEIYPGENELSSMAMGALRVLRGEEKALEYK